ncbi:head-tail adaptor protein [Chromobacterium rhizoryzae]|uniref:Head-tail adaptor protein n=2 Tax=Chromobacterium TaxID=535 RepID=A0AAD0RQS8_9NEIS|nr:head-tail adaptor protein [Chromobacterium rhizoryzae]AXT46611.1 head-tail adaptor protein [Chromobacterium rhizoryzae]
MRAGRLRHLVQIQREVKRKNDHGENVSGWELVCKTRANVADFTGRDRIGDVTLHQIDARAFLRWRPGIEAGMRLVHVKDGVTRTYTVKAPPIDRDGRRRDMELILEFDDGRQPQSR